MAFRDKDNKKVSVGDTVEYKEKQYIIKVIEEYDIATEVVVESVDKDHKVKTFLLRDVKKV